MCNNILPTKAFLHRRISNSNLPTICTTCNAGEEDIHHLFNSCPKAKEIWTFSDKWWMVFNIQLNDVDWLWKIYNIANNTPHVAQWQTTISTAPWTIWFSRNDLIFNKVVFNTKQMKTLILHRSYMWCSSGGLLHHNSLDTWIKNPTLTIKNLRILFLDDLKNKWDYIGFIDGSWKDDNNHLQSGIGGYVVNKNDDLCFIFSGPMTATTPLEAETKALIFLLQKLNEHFTMDKKIIILTDSIELWTNVKRYKTCNTTFVQCTDPVDLVELQHIHLDHIKCSHNFGVDYLAKQGRIKPNIIWRW